MNTYYYQIKGRDADGNWQWPPLSSGKVEANDRKEAREILQTEFDQVLTVKVSNKSHDPQNFLLSLDDITQKKYLLDRFVDIQCKHCEVVFTLNQKYLLNAGGGREFCSTECDSLFKKGQGIVWNADFDFNGIHEAVIYKITSKIDGRCYVGKTTQAFTLRWYQHFYQSSGTKFHDAIRQQGLCAWTFEVIEIIEIPKDCGFKEKHRIIIERETFWINHYNSIANGFNCVISMRDHTEIKTLPDASE